MDPLIIASESCEHGACLEDCKDPNCQHKLQQNSIILEGFENDQLLKKVSLISFKSVKEKQRKRKKK